MLGRKSYCSPPNLSPPHKTRSHPIPTPASKKCLFDPNFFDRIIRSAHFVEKHFFSTGCADRISLLDRESFCSPPNLSPPHKTRSHPTTAPMLASLLPLLLLLCSLWRLSTKSNATTAMMKQMSALRAPNERFARGFLFFFFPPADG